MGGEGNFEIRDLGFGGTHENSCLGGDGEEERVLGFYRDFEKP